MQAGRVLSLLALAALTACGESPVSNTPALLNAAGESAALAAACSGCHAAGNADLVSLSGRDAADLYTSLKTYKDDTTGGTVMHRIARGYSDADLDAISTYLSVETSE